MKAIIGLLGALLAASEPADAATVTINGAQTYQTIDGFGVNANSGNWTNNEVQPVLDALINQAGITLFLAEFVGNDNWETSNANPGPSLTNWSYFNSVYSGPNFQQLWGMMAYLNQRGITNGLMPKFTGAAALWMGGQSLSSGHENDYAKMLASALIYARQTQHLQFTEVPPLNEPDLIGFDTGVQLSGGSQFVTVVDDLGRLLDANGMSDVRFSGPELATTSTSWMGTMLGDSYLMSKLGHFGLHSYIGNGPDASGVSSFIQQSAYPNTRFWMTEFGVWCQSCLNGTGGDGSWSYARGTVAYLLTLLAEGASGGLVFEAWDGRFRGYNTSTGQDTPGTWDFFGLFAVDNINAVHKTYTPRKQFYTFSQITKYVRPGATRIGVSGASSPLTVLAFNNTNNGQFTVTGVNTGSSATTLSCTLTSLPTIPSLDLYYTTSTANLSQGAHVTVNNGAFSVGVPADCVFTLVGSISTGATVSALINNPLDGASYAASATIPIQAGASTSSGTIMNVTFFNGATNLGQAVASPYGILWNNLAPGTYVLTARATNSSGNFGVSPAVHVTVVAPPTITQQPQSQAVEAGGTVAFNVIATGAAPLNYQWSRNQAALANGGNISGANTPTLTFTTLTQTNAGNCTVVITNAGGSVTSSIASLTVVMQPNLAPPMLLPDGSLRFSVSATPNLTYRVDASTNLVDWTALTNIANPSGTIQFIEPNATNFSQRFYRAVWVP